MDKYRCPEKCSDEPTEHTFLEEHGDYNEFYKIQCAKCQTTHTVHRHEWLSFQVKNDVKPRKAYLTKYPYVEPHSGEVVHSKEHREETMKRMGFHAAPHGIDRNYD